MLSDDERFYLTEWTAALDGDYNRLPMRIPERIRQQMEQALMCDTTIRQLDEQGRRLAAVAHQFRSR